MLQGIDREENRQIENKSIDVVCHHHHRTDEDKLFD